MKNIKLINLIVVIVYLLIVNEAIGQSNELERRISFVAKEQTMAEVLSKITELSKVKFSYSKEELPSLNVNLTVNNETILSVLDRLFINTGLEYRLINDMMAIRKITQASTKNLHLSLSGSVIDAENLMPLAFASISVLKKAKGTITNTSGSFVLNLPSGFQSDTLQISMMGYSPVRIPIYRSDDNIIIKMKPQPVMLKEVEVTNKRITVEDIFQEIRSRIKLNYPVEEYAMECFYREIKKENNTYQSLLEAALLIRDRGYDQPKSREDGYIREVRGSSKFINRFSNFWQEDNLLRETLGLNAVRHHSSTPNVFGENSYQLQGITKLNDKEVYVLISDIIKNDCWQRTLYVDVETYAIYRSEETIKNFELSWKVENKDSVYMRLTSGTSVFDFKAYNDKLYLNHIRHEVENEYFNPLTKKIYGKFTIINELLVNDIYEDPRTHVKGLKRVENLALELQVTPYNEAFWQNFNAIKQTPIESKIMSDLLEKGTLDVQFKSQLKKSNK